MTNNCGSILIFIRIFKDHRDITRGFYKGPVRVIARNFQGFFKGEMFRGPKGPKFLVFYLVSIIWNF